LIVRSATAVLLVLAASVPALNEGMATHFLAVGQPYGACGVSDSVAAAEGAMDTLSGQANPFDYVALNAFHTPGVYTMPAPRPMVGKDTVFMGAYDNGRNCGRWVRLTLGDTCDGINDGAAGKEFCRGGTGWHPNEYTGGTIHAIVFDQCTDGNAWCRDSKWHLDLHTPILARLRKNGTLLPPMAVPALDASGKPLFDANNPWSVVYVVNRFLNPKVSWEFVKAPNYQGEPRFWFSVDSKPYYQRIIVTHLPNGIHMLQQQVGNEWKNAKMEGDMGQLWILPDPSVNTFTLRIVDVQDSLAMGGRTWTMDFPKACGTVCTRPATIADNVIGKGGAVSVLPERARRAISPKPTSDGMLIFPGGLDGWIDLVSASGRALPRVAVASGRAKLPVNAAGVWFARWNVGGTEGNGSLLLR
jgi:hypothetical protein